MTTPPPQALSITADHTTLPLSAEQQSFNTLTADIAARRARLQEWETASTAFHKKYAEQYVPLETELLSLKRQTVLRLHDAWPDKELSKGERLSLSAIIADMAQALLQRADDAELKLIFNQHGDADDEEDDASDAGPPPPPVPPQEIAEDDFTTGTPEEIMQRMEAMLERQEQERLAAAQAREHQRASRRKPPRQRATEARLQEQRKELSQSIRAVYRKLASALHPDREPDETERARKTALMQQVNQAYEKNDLLKLLELQLELEHINQAALKDLNDTRLAHYNQILREQLAELDQEIAHMEQGFRHSFGLPAHTRLAPETVVRHLNKAMAALRQDCQDMRSALVAFGDIQQIRGWVRQVR